MHEEHPHVRTRSVSKERSERNEQLDHVDSGLLDALDRQYYALSDAGTEDLEALILAFMARHAREPVIA